MNIAASSSLPLGFKWTSATAGIKASGRPDMAIAFCESGAAAGAMFTSNQMVAAPVSVGRRHLKTTGSIVKAVLVNSGNANCATGTAGLDACHKSCIALADAVGCVFDEVFPSSTGIIGVPLPVEKLIAAAPAAAATLGDSPEHAASFARAILTTDTKIKIAAQSFEVAGKRVSLWGCSKGAGMIGPQLVSQAQAPHATMLVYLFTDLAASADQLNAMLAPAVERSFNSISIDGDMSTNDTVLLLASGRSGVEAKGEAVPLFEAALLEVSRSLARQIVDDGEGVTHVVTLDVTGARSDAEAKAIARTIGESPLCKTAWSSADPNWGRLLAAAGRAGVDFDPNDITIEIAGLPVFAEGMRSPAFDEAATHTAMSAREYTISLDLHQGTGKSRFLTCDLTHEYVSINADYST